jgi:hypothetical protein
MLEEDKIFFESLGVKFEDEKGEFDNYKYFACSQGILIANALETEEKIVEYNKLGWEEQKRLVPGISDEHSGGTWGLAINAAVRYLPMLLVNKRDKKIDDILN